MAKEVESSSKRTRDEESPVRKSDFFKKMKKCMVETDAMYEKIIGG